MKKILLSSTVLFFAFYSVTVFAEPVAEDDTVKCSDGIDNDEDGTVDCDDAECSALLFCQKKPAPPAAAVENTAGTCQDGADNDMDGYIDCADQDCLAFVFCAQAKPAPAPAPAPILAKPVSQPVKVSHGRGLFIAGTVLSSLGMVAMIAGTALAWNWHDDFDDEYVGRTVGPFCGGFGLNIIGGGMILGAVARPFKSLRNLGESPSAGFRVGGGILYGFNIAIFAVMAALGPTVGPSPAPYFTVAMTTTLLTFIINAVGWSRYSGRLKKAQQTQATESNSGIRIMPYVSPTRSGAVAGIAAIF